MMLSKKYLTSKVFRQTLSRLKSFLKQKMASMVECLRTFFDGSPNLKTLGEVPYGVLERRLWVATTLLVAIALIVIASGCSPTKEIAKASTGIATAATSSKSRFSLIHNEAESPAPDVALISDEAVGGLAEQDQILSYTSLITHNLTSVEDKVPYWMTVTQYGIIVVGILGVCFLLWYTGIGSLIKRLIGFIPKAKRREADLAAAVMNDGSPATMREFVAARRASDPEFDKAYERAATERDRTIR